MQRNDANATIMHNITYSYPDNQNRLNSITATGLNSSNYLYDRLGNLTRDGGEGITIAWNTSGKVKSVTGGSSPLDFSYSALGQRQMKAYQADEGKAFDYYIHDATGNIMAIYTLRDNYSLFQLKEQHIYGSSRLGIYNRNIEIYPSEEVIPLSFTRGLKRYELSNHLGNVNAVISDRKIQFKGGYMADIKSYVDYYPFGYQIPERTWSSSDYRFGFNGQEKDDEIYGEGNSTTAEYWQYDARLGRRWNLDPVVRPFYSGYATFSNNPIIMVDPSGDADYFNSFGTWIGTDGNYDRLTVIITSGELERTILTSTLQGMDYSLGAIENGSVGQGYFAINRYILASASGLLTKALENPFNEFSRTFYVTSPNFVFDIGEQIGTFNTVYFTTRSGLFVANVAVHAHSTGGYIDEKGKIQASSTRPSSYGDYSDGGDEAAFPHFEMNIIVGYKEEARTQEDIMGKILQNEDKSLKLKTRTPVIDIYGDSIHKKLGSISQNVADKILLAEDRGKYGRTYTQKKKERVFPTEP